MGWVVQSVRMKRPQSEVYEKCGLVVEGREVKVHRNIKVELNEELKDKLALLEPNLTHYRIRKKSVDARQRRAPHFNYTVETYGPGEEIPTSEYLLESLNKSSKEPPIVIGAGPAGLFAALRLAERGLPCRLFEQGSEARKRMYGITQYWRYGRLNPRDNVCYGEGGAGLFSDGKLITRIKSPHIPYVLNRLVRYGAPREIEYLSNPHVGSDRIRRVIPKLRQGLRELGTQFHYNTKVTELICDRSNQVKGIQTETGEEFYSPYVVLATGHSSEDMFYKLSGMGVKLESKPFAMGLRVEHLQKQINQIQYRDFSDHPQLGAANYRLSHHDLSTGVGVFSFCMCPGGYVLSSGTDERGIVCNGMSNYKRNSPFANAAIVVTIDDKQFLDTFGGMKYRKRFEEEGLQMVEAAGGSKELPVQSVMGFLNGKWTEALPSSSLSGVVAARLDQLFEAPLKKAMVEALEKFDRTMRGFIHESAQLHGVESRTSCPIRIPRDKKSLESLSHPGLYPSGEGAGYAGGITSAACDGIRVAEKIVERVGGRVFGENY